MTKATFVNFFYRSYQVLLTDVVIIPGELYRLLGASSLKFSCKGGGGEGIYFYAIIGSLFQ